MKLRDHKKATSFQPGYLHADGMETIEYKGEYFVSVNDIITMLDEVKILTDGKAALQAENIKAGFVGLRMEAHKVATKVVKE